MAKLLLPSGGGGGGDASAAADVAAGALFSMLCFPQRAQAMMRLFKGAMAEWATQLSPLVKLIVGDRFARLSDVARTLAV
jgi:hypothetical protein